MIQVSTGLLTPAEVSIALGEDELTVIGGGLGFAALPDEMGVDRLAQFAYYAYGSESEWKNYQGLPMPKWADLPSSIQKAWMNSTKAILSASGALDGIPSKSKYAHPILKTVGDQQGFEAVT